MKEDFNLLNFFFGVMLKALNDPFVERRMKYYCMIGLQVGN